MMREENRKARMREIEATAHKLFMRHGFEATSMLAIAKAAKASNETLYRWYGDKKGLFESMVQANADKVRDTLAAAVESEQTPSETLRQVAATLLGMLLSDEAIMLNRAAASDPTGALGRILSSAGREAVLPLMAKVLEDAIPAWHHGPSTPREIGPNFLRLLVGDQQIRRVIGVLPVPSPDEVKLQADLAVKQLQQLCAPASS